MCLPISGQDRILLGELRGDVDSVHTDGVGGVIIMIDRHTSYSIISKCW